MATKSKNIQNPWTDAEIEILQKMWIERKTAQEISPFIGGRSEKAIWSKVKLLKIKRPYVKRLKDIGTFKELRGTPKKVTPYIEPVFTGGKPLIDLKPTECRYPYNGLTSCGEPSIRLYGYCREHHDLCYKPVAIRVRKF